MTRKSGPDYLSWLVFLRMISLIALAAVIVVSRVSRTGGDYISYGLMAGLFVLCGLSILREDLRKFGKFGIFGMFVLLVGLAYVAALLGNLEQFTLAIGNGLSASGLVLYSVLLLLSAIISRGSRWYMEVIRVKRQRVLPEKPPERDAHED